MAGAAVESLVSSASQAPITVELMTVPSYESLCVSVAVHELYVNSAAGSAVEERFYNYDWMPAVQHRATIAAPVSAPTAFFSGDNRTFSAAFAFSAASDSYSDPAVYGENAPTLQLALVVYEKGAAVPSSTADSVGWCEVSSVDPTAFERAPGFKWLT